METGECKGPGEPKELRRPQGLSKGQDGRGSSKGQGDRKGRVQGYYSIEEVEGRGSSKGQGDRKGRPYYTRCGLRSSFMGSCYIWDDLCSFFYKTRINLRWAGVAEKLPDYLEKR
ncbi:MAG: hypothetical protein ACJ8BW_12550 [Ktedonobacteraceae bacterium]